MHKAESAVNRLLEENRPFRGNVLLYAAIVLFILFWLWMGYDPYRRSNWWLENILTLAAIAAMALTWRWFRFTNLSYLLIGCFLALHTIGAHYSYYETPLDVWLKSAFGLARNPFDRIVHCAFGVLLAFPLHDLLLRESGIRRLWSCLLVPFLMLALGAFYELIEMWVVDIVDAKSGEMFLGMQGDEWDAQHDMAAAFYGAIVTMAITWAAGRLRRRR